MDKQRKDIRNYIADTIADYDVNLYLSDHSYGKPTKEQTIRALEKDIVNLLTEMAKKKRTNTQIYQRLEREVSERTSALKALTKN